MVCKYMQCRYTLIFQVADSLWIVNRTVYDHVRQPVLDKLGSMYEVSIRRRVVDVELTCAII